MDFCNQGWGLESPGPGGTWLAACSSKLSMMDCASRSSLSRRLKVSASELKLSCRCCTYTRQKGLEIAMHAFWVLLSTCQAAQVNGSLLCWTAAAATLRAGL